MAKFVYKAINQTGQTVSGTIEAPDDRRVLSILAQQNLMITELSPKKEFPKISLFAPSKKVPFSVIRDLFRQLSFLLSSGLSLYSSIQILLDFVKNRRVKEILQGVMFDLTEGSPLSKALGKFPDSFPRLHTNMIYIGESAGRLDESINNLVSILEEQQALASEIKKALTYPVLIVGMSLLLTMGMLLFVFPKFGGIFVAMEIPLPPITKFFLALSGFLISNYLILLLLIGAMVTAFVLFIQSDKGQKTWDLWKIKAPGIKAIFRAKILTQLSKTIGSLMQTGVPLVDAIGLARETVGNSYVEAFLAEVIGNVKEGKSFSWALSQNPLFPPLVIQLVSTGEHAGNLDEMLLQIAKFYRQEVNQMLNKMTASLEPMALIFVGSIIATMAISLLLPLFHMAGAGLRRKEE